MTLTTLIVSAFLEISTFYAYFELEINSRRKHREDYLLLSTCYLDARARKRAYSSLLVDKRDNARGIYGLLLRANFR